MTDSSSPSPAPRVFTVRFDDRVALTVAQVAVIERAIQATVAEQIVLLAVAATVQPLLKPESLPDELQPFRFPWGATAVSTEPPEVFGEM